MTAQHRLRIHILQHVAFEGPAEIMNWAAARGHHICTSHLYRGDSLPRASDFDFLVVMGGPMSVNDVEQHPWLTAEKELVRSTIQSGTPVLGICLGAQLIASALGCPVYPAGEKEIGWFLATRCSTQGAGALFPEDFTPLHWHGETFDLPQGAELLASTPAVPHQAFQVGRRVLGLQFHIEATQESVETMLQHVGHEITEGRFQQQPEEIRRGTTHCTALHPLLWTLLDYLVE